MQSPLSPFLRFFFLFTPMIRPTLLVTSPPRYAYRVLTTHAIHHLPLHPAALYQTRLVSIKRQHKNASTVSVEPCFKCSDTTKPSPIVEDRLPYGDEGVMQSTFYRRPLPHHLIAFDSADGKKLFRECLDAGHAEGYFHLAGNFASQSEPAYCGPSSLAMVLNALQIDPRRRWKGAWRWYTDELLEGCLPLSVVKRKGITFSQFTCLASGHCDVEAKRPEDHSYEEFVEDIRRVTSRTDNQEHMVVSFARATLGQTGDGHFSPIGAFCPRPSEQDTKGGLVLVLDVARFKYPSYFCQTKLLYEATKPLDRTTGKSRGWFLLRPRRDAPVYGCASACKDWA
jgi:hypothetical protein